MTRSESGEKPLQSWKEIAAYLERDTRTAYRWEKEAGLPVRRYTDGSRSSVYAYPSEIEAWRTARPTQSETETPVRVPLWRRMEAWAAVAVGVAAILVITYGPFLNPRNPVAAAAEGSMRAEQVWTGDDADLHSRLSPDGTQLSFVDWSTGDLFVRDVASGDTRALTNKGSWDEDQSMAVSIAIAPNAARVAYAWFHDGGDRYPWQVRVGSASGGPEGHNPTVLFETDEDGGHVTVFGWLSNAEILFLHVDGDKRVRFLIADLDQTKVTALKSLDWSYPEGVAISPDGHWIAYGLKRDLRRSEHDIHVLAADGSEATIVARHPSNDVPVAWTPDGSHLLFRSRRSGNIALWAVPMQNGTAGTPTLVNPESAVVRSVGMSPQSDLYYVKRTGTRDIYITEIDLEERRVTSEPKRVLTTFVGGNRRPSFSPDGKWLAYLSNRSLRTGYGDRTVVARDLETGEEHELDPGQRAHGESFWSHDSKSVLFRGEDRKARMGVYRAPLDGGPAELMFYPQGGNLPANFGPMPDGESMHYRERNGPTGKHRIRNMVTGAERLITLPDGDSWLSVSPDGTRFAVMDRRREKGVNLLLTLDAETMKERELLRVRRPEWVAWPTQWSPDGKYILFWRRNEGDKQKQLWAIPADGGEPWHTGLTVDRGESPGRGHFSIHPDGRRITFATGTDKYEIWKLSNFLSRLGVSD